MRRPGNVVLWSVVAGVAIVLAAVFIRLERERAEPVAAPPTSAGLPTTAAPTTTATTIPSVTTTPSWACGTVAGTDADGRPLPAGALDQAVRVHDAACRRDFDALLAEMDTPFGNEPPEQAVAALRADPGEVVLLAQTLEAPAAVDQGGLFFCHPGGAAAVFARGTLDRPGKWSAFLPPSSSLAISLCGR
ncbi:hypothetical protein ACQPZF_28055 [Actinosynnema sp. CS-041913]|uniref:hypothetical protein n=1 Tax=Actinosynnema sp. CS-041913 TaxID=3239917 RepID=UPI003D8EF8B5